MPKLQTYKSFKYKTNNIGGFSRKPSNIFVDMDGDQFKIELLHDLWSVRKYNFKTDTWDMMDFRVHAQVEELILKECGSDVLFQFHQMVDMVGEKFFDISAGSKAHGK